MDIWLYYHATHLLHRYLNPISEQAVRELASVLEMGPGTRVLDIASGKGSMLQDFAEWHGAGGVGVDISPYFIEAARRGAAERVPDAGLEFVEMGAAEYETAERFDVALCIGASWIWNGYAGTLEALAKLARPGGLIVSGEPFWRKKAPAEYLAREDFTEETFGTLDDCRRIAEEQGLAPLWMRGASEQEWDRYETLQLASLDRFAREDPDHPDLDAIREKHRPYEENYLRWGREIFGFAVWVFRTPAG